MMAHVELGLFGLKQISTELLVNPQPKKEIAGARKQEFRMFLNEFWHKLTYV